MMNGCDRRKRSKAAASISRRLSLRQKLWQMLEIPNSSNAAMAYMVASCILVIITMVVLIISSLPEFQYKDPYTNTTEILPGLEITDAFCVFWFSFDYLIRLFACPARLVYVKSPLSIIDLAAIFPFYIELLFNYIGIQSGAFGDVRRTLIILRILRVLRVLRALRVLKVARYSSGFQSMGQALKRSWRELTLLIMFTLTANLMFSTAMYYFEVDHPDTDFPSIPAACWWCIITMTTVGYGDVYPRTVIGKILGGLVSITGIILLAFPISVIVETFNEEYQERTNNARAAMGQLSEQDDKDSCDATSAKDPTIEEIRPSALRASAAVVAQDFGQSLRMIDGQLYWQVQKQSVAPLTKTKRKGKFF